MNFRLFLAKTKDHWDKMNACPWCEKGMKHIGSFQFACYTCRIFRGWVPDLIFRGWVPDLLTRYELYYILQGETQTYSEDEMKRLKNLKSFL